MACRPGALTEDQFAEWLKAESELTKETCDEPDPSDKCGAKPAGPCPKDDDPEPPEKTLTENETFSSFQNWQQSLLFSFAFDSQFAEFLVDGAAWRKTTTANPTRGRCTPQCFSNFFN